MKKYLYNIVLALSICLFTTGCSNDGTTKGGNDGKGGSLATFALKGDYLYTVDHQNLTVFSINDIKNPKEVGKVNVGFGIETLFSFNDYLFIGSRDAMYIYSVKNPKDPKELSRSNHFNACDPVVANETHAFVTLHSNNNCGNNRNELIIYDIDDLEKPKVLHTIKLKHPKGLVLYKNYLAVCDDRLKIFDISDIGKKPEIEDETETETGKETETGEKPEIVNDFEGKFKDLVIYNNILFAFGENKITQYKWEGDNFKDLILINTLEY